MYANHTILDAIICNCFPSYTLLGKHPFAEVSFISLIFMQCHVT